MFSFDSVEQIRGAFMVILVILAGSILARNKLTEQNLNLNTISSQHTRLTNRGGEIHPIDLECGECWLLKSEDSRRKNLLNLASKKACILR